MIVTLTPNPVLDRTLSVPRIEFDDVLRASSTRLDWGGKGFNVSRALKALGRDSVAMAFAGGGTGQMLRQGLDALGITTDFVEIAGETRTNVVVVDQATGRHIKVNEAGPTISAQEHDELLQRIRERVQPDDLWVLAGSLPPGLPIGFYAEVIDLLQASGAQAFLDTSGEPLRLGCVAQPALVKPNVAEAEELTGQVIDSPHDASRAAGHFLDQGVEMVALSMGAQGLVLASASQAVWARPPGVSVTNPTGAGDSLLAGIVWALQQGLPLAEVASWGVATGTASAMREGVSVGSRAAVEALRLQVEVVDLRDEN
ncbi:MAG: 1-phosphofructokinase [Anaerolineae bacterium]|nr:1-phosphofructokinase [Anaerolineae bacterium]MCB9129922.1 1-phosphofructokinase [Anaerolineales bacterium]